MSHDGWFSGRKLSLFVRNFHINVHCSGADKQLLGRLRKTTGFSFVNCRKALEQSNNDLKQVTEYTVQACAFLCTLTLRTNSNR